MSKNTKQSFSSSTEIDKELEKIFKEYLFGLMLSSGNCFSMKDGVGTSARIKATFQIKSTILKELLERMPERKEWEVIDHQDYGYNEALEDCLEVIEETLQ